LHDVENEPFTKIVIKNPNAKNAAVDWCKWGIFEIKADKDNMAEISHRDGNTVKLDIAFGPTLSLGKNWSAQKAEFKHGKMSSNNFSMFDEIIRQQWEIIAVDKTTQSIANDVEQERVAGDGDILAGDSASQAGSAAPPPPAAAPKRRRIVSLLKR
jgi:hypothetical protein